MVGVHVDRPVREDRDGTQLDDEPDEPVARLLARVGRAVDLVQPVKLRADRIADALLLGRADRLRVAVREIDGPEAPLAVGVVADVDLELVRRDEAEAERMREIVRMRRHDEDAVLGEGEIGDEGEDEPRGELTDGVFHLATHSLMN